MTPVAFPSGHVTLSQEEFDLHYRDKLLHAISSGHNFVLGSAAGADTMVLDFLLAQGVDVSRIKVFVFEKSPSKDQACRQKCAALGIPFQFGFNSYTQRDAELTANSTYDIAWVRPPDQAKQLLGDSFNPDRISGTQRNLDRRAKNGNYRPTS